MCVMKMASLLAQTQDQANLSRIAQILIDNGAELEVVGTRQHLLLFEMAEMEGNFELTEYLRRRTPFPHF